MSQEEMVEIAAPSPRLMHGEQPTLLDLYDKYKNLLASIPFDGKFADYDWGNLPSQLSPGWMAYALMFQEFSREIANSINQLVSYTHRLKTWGGIISGLDEQKTFEVLNEFIEPMATVALNLPYVVRSRFIFATAHLAHQVNRAMDGKDWRDDLPLDQEIHFQTADVYGAKWRRYPELKRCLERVSARDFQEATGNFRHKYNHRFSPRIVVGHVGFVSRSFDPATKQVCYGFGEIPPLPLERVTSLLENQCRYCHDAFDAFKIFIGELESMIHERPM